MASELLRPLLHTVWEAYPFGFEGFGKMMPSRQEQIIRQMEAVRIGFEEDMENRLQQGLPDVGVAVRKAMVKHMSAKTVAFSPGLSAGELADTRSLIQMAVLTGITGVGNTLLDQGDTFMRSAILRLCGTHPNPERAPSVEETTRLVFLQGIEAIIPTIVPPEDCETTLYAVRDQLMANEVVAHDLTMAWKEEEKAHKTIVWDEDTVAYTLLVTAALPSATTPLYGIYRQQNKSLPTVDEIWHDSSVQKLLIAANANIRVRDDFGDRQRDASPERRSINLFNEATSPHGARVIDTFCVQAGLKDHRKIDELITAFRAVGEDKSTEKAVRAITHEFEQNFAEVRAMVPETYNLYTALVIRALAAGVANTVGDDALIEPTGLSDHS